MWVVPPEPLVVSVPSLVFFVSLVSASAVAPLVSAAVHSTGLAVSSPVSGSSPWQVSSPLLISSSVHEAAQLLAVEEQTLYPLSPVDAEELWNTQTTQVTAFREKRKQETRKSGDGTTRDVGFTISILCASCCHPLLLLMHFVSDVLEPAGGCCTIQLKRSYLVLQRLQSSNHCCVGRNRSLL